MKFTVNAVALAFALPRAAQSLAPTLQKSGACAAPLTEEECEDAAADLGARWSGAPIDSNKPSAGGLPGGCFAVERAGGKDKVRWNAHKEPGTGCRGSRPCVCPGPPVLQEVQCNAPSFMMASSAQALQLAAGCYTQASTMGCDVDTVLTPDFLRFMAPAIDCVNDDSGTAAVFECLRCLGTYTDGDISDVCRETAADTSTYLLDPDKCLTECLGTTCQEELETNLLCSLASPSNGITTGYASFTCPTFD